MEIGAAPCNAQHHGNSRLASSSGRDAAISSDAVCERVQGVLGRLEQLVAKAVGSAPRKPAIDANRLGRVVVIVTHGLAVVERAGFSRRQLREFAATFVDALVGDQ